MMDEKTRFTCRCGYQATGRIIRHCPLCGYHTPVHRLSCDVCREPFPLPRIHE